MTTAQAAAKTKADEQRDKAAEKQAALAQADADFREDVAKAAEKRQKVIDEYSDGTGNIAETAWNETKSEEDPVYRETTGDHRRKLDVAVDAIRTTGNSDIVGLEDFEARVVELLAEAGVPAGSGPSYTPAALLEEGEETTEASAKRGTLPADFPHRDALDAAGYNTYARVRALNGDYSDVPNVGKAKGAEIDEAL